MKQKKRNPTQNVQNFINKVSTDVKTVFRKKSLWIKIKINC